MAIWQFELHLLPEATLRGRYGGVPITLPASEVEEGTNWIGVSAPPDLRDGLSRILSKGMHWSTTVDTWGDEDGDRIDVVWDDDRICDIRVRVDVRTASYQFTASVLQMARANQWVLWVDSGHVLKPVLRRLLREIERSDSFRFVQDPHAFIAQVRRLEDER